MPESTALGFLTDFALGGVSGAIAKTCTAPIERVKLVCQPCSPDFYIFRFSKASLEGDGHQVRNARP